MYWVLIIEKNLIALTETVKQNLRVYLSQYRIITDLQILKTYTINIGVRFSIITQRGYNKNEVLLRCIDFVKNHFDIDKWSISQPIILSDILCDIISRW